MAVLLIVELARSRGAQVPVPFLLLYASVVLAAIAGGTVPGALAGAASAAYIVFAAQVDFGPRTLTGGWFQVTLGCLLYLSTGVMVGLVREHRDRLLAAHVATGAELEAKVEARTQEVERAHEALRNAQKMQALGLLTGGVAHEFNNLLMPILGNASLLQEAEPVAQSEELTELAGQILRAGDRASALVRQMLAFSRSDPAETAGVVSLQSEVDEALALLQPMLPRGVSLRKLSECADAAVRARSVDLQQAIINLCVNASDAMEGSGTITIATKGAHHVADRCASCGLVCEGTWCSLQISDDGPGIPLEVQERIFEPFFTTKSLGEGTGMGMPLVHGIVHSGHGHILVRSGDSGTTITLLLDPQDDLPSRDAVEAPANSRPTVRLDNLSIMVVDDDPETAAVFGAFLRLDGAERTIWHEPEAALDHLKQSDVRVDLLLTDYNMPVMNGAELLRAAREVRPDLPAMICTGVASDATLHALAGQPRTQVLQKPVDRRRLNTEIRALLDEGPSPHG